MTVSIAAIIIGIDGWTRYTLPLVESIRKHEPSCLITVIDNASKEPYRGFEGLGASIKRTERLCYSAAINYAHDNMTWRHWDTDPRVRYTEPTIVVPDWYIVLSNDVLCTGPFAHVLEGYSDDNVVGPLLKHVHGFDYLEGWAIATPSKVWNAIGEWDVNFRGSSYEDVWWSTEARLHGATLVEDLPFVHLDQRQRYHVIPDFAGTDTYNREYFLGKYGKWAT